MKKILFVILIMLAMTKFANAEIPFEVQNHLIFRTLDDTMDDLSGEGLSSDEIEKIKQKFVENPPISKGSIQKYCKRFSKNSEGVSDCIDRLKLYVRKEDQLISCMANGSAMVSLMPAFNSISPNGTDDEGMIGLTRLADIASQYNCSISKVFTDFANQGNEEKRNYKEEERRFLH